MKQRIVNTVLVTMTIITTGISQSLYKGKLTYTVNNNETDSFYAFAEISGKNQPFSRYLNTKDEYTISGDTLILEKYDEFDELYFVNIQIGSDIWCGSNYSGNEYSFSELINVSNFEVDICLIENWDEIKHKESDIINVKNYSGQAIQNEITNFKISVIANNEITKQVNMDGLFCKIFCEHGLIVESVRTFRNQTTERKLQEKIENESINCSEIMSKYLLRE